ncbi:MAG: hypothetical protein QW674_07035 [Candidatus Bathyarchaeia archaeon]
MIVMLVGVLVTNSLINSVVPNSTWSAEANSTWNTIKSNVWIAFSLVAIGILVMGAVAILSVLRGEPPQRSS